VKANALAHLRAGDVASLILLKASLFPPMPSPSVSFPGENLDHIGRTTMVPFALLPP